MQRRVADDDRDPLQPVAQVARRRRGPRAIDRPVPAWPPSITSCADSRAAREAADAVDLAQRVEPVEAAGQQLVRVGLVAGVPDDPVARRLEQPVERERELDDAQRGAEVAAGRGDGADDRLAELARRAGRARRRQAAEVGGALRGGRGWARREAPGSARSARPGWRRAVARGRRDAPRSDVLSDGAGCLMRSSERAVRGSASSLLGVLGADVRRGEGAAGPGDQLLDAELGLGEQPLAAALEGDATLVQGDRRLERLAAGLERRDGRAGARRRPRRRRAASTSAVAGRGLASASSTGAPRVADRPSTRATGIPSRRRSTPMTATTRPETRSRSLSRVGERSCRRGERRSRDPDAAPCRAAPRPGRGRSRRRPARRTIA